MADESPQVRLPGQMFRRKTRWWWKVQLPGETSPRSRALKPEGKRQATTDRREAQEIAFALWQNAIRAETEEAVKAREAAKAENLKAKFQERARAMAEIMEKARAQAKAEATARTKLEAQLQTLKDCPPHSASCECCGDRVPHRDLRRIDTGQQLCPVCLQALHKEEQRQEAKHRFLCPA